MIEKPMQSTCPKQMTERAGGLHGLHHHQLAALICYRTLFSKSFDV